MIVQGSRFAGELPFPLNAVGQIRSSLRRKDFVSAKDALEGVISIDSTHVSVAMVAVELYAQLNAIEKVDQVVAEHTKVSADRGAALVAKAIRHLIRAGYKAELWTLAARYAQAQLLNHESLVLLSGAITRAEHLDQIHAWAEHLDGDRKASLFAIVASRLFDLEGAAEFGARISPLAPERRMALKSLFRTAMAARDFKSAAITADTVLELSDEPDIGISWSAARAASSSGLPDLATKFFAKSYKFARRIQSSTTEFKKRWRPLAAFYFEMFEIERANEILERVRSVDPEGFANIGDREVFVDFLTEFKTEIAWSKDQTKALIMGAPFAPPPLELVRIISRPKIYNPGNKNTLESQYSWIRTVREVYRQCAASGKTATLIPGYLAAFCEDTPAPAYLSYHTHGKTKNTKHFKEADLPNYISLNTDGYAGWHGLASQPISEMKLERFEPKQVAKFYDQNIELVKLRRISKYQQASDAVLWTNDRRYVFVALQVSTDEVQALARIDMFSMLRIVADRFHASGIDVVVKRHPLCRDPRVSILLNELLDAGRITLTQASIYDLMPDAEAVMTVNSGVGSEALNFLKPVYLFGEADYSAVCHNVTDAEDFAERTSPIKLAVPDDTVRRFLVHYRRCTLVDTLDGRQLQRAVETRLINPALRGLEHDQPGSETHVSAHSKVDLGRINRAAPTR